MEGSSTTVTPRETTPTEPSTPPERSSDVALVVACASGDSLAGLPFDPVRVPFLDEGDDPSWAGITITAENSGSTWVQIDPRFEITFYALDGSEIVTSTLLDSYAPAYAASPGQTITRSVYRFDLPFLSRLVSDGAADDRMVSGDLGSCELAAGFEYSEIEPAGTPEVLTAKPTQACGLTDPGDFFEAAFEFTNTGSERTLFGFAFEILDANGDRLGIGGADDLGLDSQETQTLIGFAAAFTVLDPETADNCRILEVTPN